MLFSIVVPTHNRRQLLAHTLASVRRQHFREYELIVVDDGSTDGTQAYLQDLGGEVRVVTLPVSSGPGAARNAGLRVARGDYVALLDSDDLWFPWTLEVFARAIQEHRQPHIVGGRLMEFADEAELEPVRQESYAASWFADYIASSDKPYYVGSGTGVFRREALQQAEFLEDRLNSEDHDLVLRMGILPGFVRIVAPVTLAWRRHPASETADMTSSVSGALRLLAREKAGAYPGGPERTRERQRILARHTRPIALACVKSRRWRQGWMLYRAILGWNIALGHWRYVLAFPFLTTAASLKSLIVRLRRRTA